MLTAAAQSGSDSTDTVARIIAAWGAAVATILLILQLVRFRRERARLKIWATFSTGMSGSSIAVHVINPPLAPAVTVMQVGLMCKEDDVLSLVEEPDGSPPEKDVEITVRHILPFHDGEPVLVGEGETKIFKVDLDSMPSILPEDGDEVLRSFAIDAEGRLVRGNKGRFFRELLNAGWKPEAPTPEHAFTSTAMKMVPNSRLRRLGWRWKHR